LFGEESTKALPVALAVELFHNFSLVHDDIMDNADVRRGSPSVHKKWDVNTAILSGDIILIEAYDQLAAYPPQTCKKLLALFLKTSKEVCVGQQLDVDYETANDVLISDYINMIALKTSVLLACSLQMGAIVAGASTEDQKHIYGFGKNLGIAFQVQDDLLDSFGEENEIGKKVGGDILQNKKTYLYLKALELASTSEKEDLLKFYSEKSGLQEDEKIQEVLKIFNSTHVKTYAEELKANYRDLAISHLDAIQVGDKEKKPLMQLLSFLDNRTA